MGTSPYRPRLIGGPQGRDDAEGGGVGEKYVGLVNVKNTCYVNSVLQALYFCQSFRRRAITHLAEEREDEPGGDSLLTSLGELFAQIESQKKSISCLTPRRFLTRLRKASDVFCNFEHQDAHEFLQFLLNDIMEQAKKIAKRRRERERRLQESAMLTNGSASSAQGSAAGAAGAAAGASPGAGGVNGAAGASGSASSSFNSAAGANAAGGSGQQDDEDLRTWVHDILQGYLVNQMKCLCCENVTVRREAFFDLSVDIEQHTSIAACLRAFESTERLRSSNKFFCDTCGCLQEAEKRLRIYQLPSVLTLHLKRFKYVERLGRCCRLPYRVVFPLQLRVVEHKSSQRRRRFRVREEGRSGEAWRGADPSGGGGAGAPGAASGAKGGGAGEERPVASRLFELRSVVVHIGRDSSYGHYVTVVRNSDRCVLLDDDVVRVVDPEILRSFYGSAGSGGPGGGGFAGGSHERSGGWSAEPGDRHSGGHGHHGHQHHGGGDRFGGHYSGGPYYERAPEGTCCGYLLIYEAVDEADQGSNGSTGNTAGSGPADLSNATDWISEDRNFSDSDSGDSGEERALPSRHHPHSAVDDGELTQAFEQRCLPSGTNQAWRPPGGLAPTPAAPTDAVSLSRVNVSTVTSPSGSAAEGATAHHAESDRGRGASSG